MMNQRLLAIAEMMKEGSCVADIGSDHGKLPIYLVQHGKFAKAYACDIGSGPLQSAISNIEKEGLQEKISCILSNGFEHVPDDIDAAVIAGMGFYTARDILLDAKDRLDGIKQIVVQVNNDVDLLRQFISQQHWTIEDEVIIKDRNHYYTAVLFNTSYHDAYSEEEILAGPILMQKKSALFVEFTTMMMEKYEAILKKRNRSDAKQEEFKRTLAMWQNILNQ